MEEKVFSFDSNKKPEKTETESQDFLDERRIKKKEKHIDDSFVQLAIKRIEGDELSQEFRDKIKEILSKDSFKNVNKKIALDLFIALSNSPISIYGDFNQIHPDNLKVFYQETISRAEEGARLGSVESLQLIKAMEQLTISCFDFENWHELKTRIMNAEDSLGVEKDNYFVKVKIESLTKPSFEYYSNFEKRMFVSLCWNRIVGSRVIDRNFPGLREELGIDNVFFDYKDSFEVFSDSDIDLIFEKYLKKKPLSRQIDRINNKMRLHRFADEKLQKKYQVKPLAFKYSKQIDSKMAGAKTYCYSSVSSKYGAIYSEDGYPDSFFALDSKEDEEEISDKNESRENLSKNEINKQRLNKKKTPENLNLRQILEREGFIGEKMSEIEYKKLILTYQSFLELSLRERIEKEFSIKIADFSVREQVQFVNFLFNKTTEEIEKVKFFLKESDNQDDRKNKVKSFLSLESGNLSGEQILEISENLKENPGLVSDLFAEYSRIIDESKGEIDNLTEMYNEVFSDKQIDSGKVREAIFRKGAKLLKKASEEIGQIEDQEKIGFVKSLIQNLRTEEKTQKMAVINLKIIFQEQSKRIVEIVQESKLNSLTDEEKNWARQEKGKNFTNKEEDNLFEKFSSESIKSEIRVLKIPNSFFVGNYYLILKEKGKEAAEKFKQENEEKECEERQSTTDRLKKLLDFQIDLEKQLNNFVYGEKYETSNPVFEKYQEIIDQAKNIKEIARNTFKQDKDFSEEEIERLMETVLEKAHSLLNNFSERISKGEISEEDLKSFIESYKADLIMTASIWKNFKNQIKLEDLKGVSFEQNTVEEFTCKGQAMDLAEKIYEQNSNDFYENVTNEVFLQKIDDLGQEYPEYLIQKASQINQMLETYKRNYQDRPELKKEIVDGFLDVFQNASSKTNLYLLNKDQNVMGFIRYDEQEDGKTKYAGSFNIDISLHQMSLGAALFLESLEREAENYEIVGVCDGFSPANVFYVEQGGYVVERIDTKDLEKNKFPDFHIRKNKENHKLANLTKDELLRKNLSPDVLVRRFNKKDNDWLDLMELVNKEGFVITRIVPEGDYIYCGFERKTVVKTKEESFKKAA